MIAMIEAANSTCQCRVYWVTKSLMPTESGLRLSDWIRLGARGPDLGRDEREDHRGDQSGPDQRELIRSRVPSACAVELGGLVDLDRDGGEEAVQDPDRESEVECGVDEDDRQLRVDEVGLEELAEEADDRQGRHEHLGDHHEEEEHPATGEAPAGRVVRGGTRPPR